VLQCINLHRYPKAANSYVITSGSNEAARQIIPKRRSISDKGWRRLKAAEAVLAHSLPSDRNLRVSSIVERQTATSSLWRSAHFCCLLGVLRLQLVAADCRGGGGRSTRIIRLSLPLSSATPRYNATYKQQARTDGLPGRTWKNLQAVMDAELERDLFPERSIWIVWKPGCCSWLLTDDIVTKRQREREREREETSFVVSCSNQFRRSL